MHSESKPFLALLVLLLCAVVAPSLASGEGIKPSGTAAVKATAKEDCPEKGEKKLTAAIDGKNMAYTAKTGLTPILDKDAGETAYIFSASYILDGGPRERPVMFLFNGGPGSSSAFLQVCAFAPMTVPGINHGLEMAAPPYKLQANPHSLLDVADMVFIDPVGTGYSRMAKPDKEGKEGEKKEPVKMDAYLGVQGDLESMVEFVRMWLTENDRWGAEIYLAGESYGGLRAAGMAGIMGQQIGVAPSGIVLISPALSYQDTTSGLDNNVTPFVNRIPSMAAAAQYHKRLGGALKNLSRDEVVERAVRWAAERFEPALRKGNRLERGERETLLRELSEFTGIPVRELDAQDMRMEASEFSAQLLRDEKKFVSIYDARVTAPGSAWSMDEDPMSNIVGEPCRTAFMRFLTETVGIRPKRPYLFTSFEIIQTWDFTLGNKGREGFVSTNVFLAKAMRRLPFMRVYLAMGRFDLVTPPESALSSLSRMDVPEGLLERNLTSRYYEGGHMMYTNPEALKALSNDLRVWISGKK